MRILKLVSVILGLCFFSIGCSEQYAFKEKIPTKEKVFQLLEMKSVPNGKSLKKTASFNDKKETLTFKYNDIDWNKELAFLDKINPYQSKYLECFEKKEDCMDSSFHFTRIKNKKTGSLTKLSIYPNKNTLLVKAEVEVQNVLFHKKERIEVLFLNDKIDSYYINGFQKIVTNDTIHFSITGEITD